MKATFLSHFTPSLMSPEALEGIFVQREKLAQHLVELTRENTLTASKHHTLLMGPRGIGKTHLIALLYHRVKVMDALRDRLLIAWLREEEQDAGSLLGSLLFLGIGQIAAGLGRLLPMPDERPLRTRYR